MSELAICYEPERMLPKKKKPHIFGGVQSTFYVPRATRFNLDQMGIKQRGERPFSFKRRRIVLK